MYFKYLKLGLKALQVNSPAGAFLTQDFKDDFYVMETNWKDFFSDRLKEERSRVAERGEELVKVCMVQRLFPCHLLLLMQGHNGAFKFQWKPL